MVLDINNSSQKAYTLIFGLTADPIHKGHEQVIHNSYAFANKNGFEIAEFILAPTYQPNLIANKTEPRTAFEHRFAMCELVANELNENFKYQIKVSDIEEVLYKQTGQKSYSHDTLKALNKPRQLFVLSADHFSGRWPKFRKWYRWQELVENHGLMIHQRPGHSINQSFITSLKEINPDVFVVKDLPSIDISSTYIRQQLAKNVIPSETQLNPLIAEYISKHYLYQPKQ